MRDLCDGESCIVEGYPTGTPETVPKKGVPSRWTLEMESPAHHGPELFVICGEKYAMGHNSGQIFKKSDTVYKEPLPSA
eukprot:g66071.t1